MILDTRIGPKLRKWMNLKYAQVIANQVKDVLSPHCSQIEIVGSIRRKKGYVHDIDLVCVPSNQGQFIVALQSLGKFKLGGEKRIEVQLKDITADIYIATPETWTTLLLIRTGSKEHNKKLCVLARQKGMILHADGRGLYKIAPKQTEYEDISDEPVICTTELQIFEALGLPYRKPEDR